MVTLISLLLIISSLLISVILSIILISLLLRVLPFPDSYSSLIVSSSFHIYFTYFVSFGFLPLSVLSL